MKNNFLPTEFCISNVRCFDDLQKAQLRPITFLIGENSTGKTSFLGCYSLMLRMFHELPFRSYGIDFNDPPFDMGSFKDIIRNPNSNNGRDEKFVLKLGYESSDSMHKDVTVIFVKSANHPNIQNLRFELKKAFIEITPSGTKQNKFLINVNGNEVEIETQFDLIELLSLGILSSFTFHEVEEPLRSKISRFLDQWFHGTNKAARESSKIMSLRAVAPLRASPRRTYNPVKERLSPQGDHIPMYLIRLSQEAPDRWKKLRLQLNGFGEKSGMFSDLGPQIYGDNGSNPFEIRVQARSDSAANLMDVGYGVSQILPILVDILSTNDTQFILQQPEVHLHPRAQAELASLFVNSVNSANNRFLIETHSDFFINRVRINVKQGKISADDVSILYFEPTDESVKIHNLYLDENGNLEGAPDGYRNFFLNETDRLLGFDSLVED